MKAKPKKQAKPSRIRSKSQKNGSSAADRNRPPKSGQYQPGQSGNPKGRPKGSKNLATILSEAARDQVTATINGKPRKISKLQATAMQLATKAAAGDRAAMAKFLDWMDEIETRAAAARPAQFPLSEVDLAVLRAAYERMRQSDPRRSGDETKT
jgi:hypothetical protein